MDKIWKFFTKKKSFSFLIVAALILMGFSSVISIPKESNPEIQIPIAIVSTVFPGASPEDVEKLVTNKIEEQLEGSLDELQELTSSSRENISSIVVEFNANANIEESIQEVKDEVDKVKGELPEEAEEPNVLEINFADEPIIIASVASDLPVTEFIRLGDRIESELKTINGVSKVEKSGLPEREVQVIVSKEALNKFGINLVDVTRAISFANSSLPVGNIEQKGIEYAVKFEGDIENTEDISNIAILSVNGNPIYVRDVAFVSDGVSKATTLSRLSVGGELSQQSLTLSVFKKRGGDITKISGDVREKLDELKLTELKDASVSVTFDMGEFISEDLTNLTRSGLQTILLVMFLLLLALGWKEALIAGSAIPTSFLIAFIGLNASGNTINFVSLFSLILAIGILVDSSIVMVEGVHTKLRKGLGRLEAVFKTIEEFHWPITAGTLTTVAVFFPLFFISGITGKFIAIIPFTVIFVLLASLVVALAIIPLFAKTFLKVNEGSESKMEQVQEKYTEKLQGWHKKNLLYILTSRTRQNLFLVGIVGLLIVSIALPITGVVKTIFFPQDDFDFVYLEVERPQGTTLLQTDIATRQVEEILYRTEDIESFVTTIGGGSAFNENSTAGSRFSNITIVLNKDRKIASTEFLENLRAEFAQLKNLDVKIFQPSSGPPVGAPIAVKFLGENFAELEEAASRAEDLLKNIPGTAEVQSSTQSDVIDFVLSVDRAKAAQVGLNVATIAQELRASVNGLTATTIKSLEDDIDVVVKLALNPDYITPGDTTRTTLESIRFAQINTPSGPVLLGSLLKDSIQKGNASISHENRKRVATVTSQISQGAITGDILREFQSRLAELELPSSIEVSFGGEDEEVQQSFQDMFIALIFGLILMMAIIVLQFNSFRDAFFVISIVPFSLIGILFGLAISRQTLSFPSMLGFVALAGIVVNNSILLIDQMRHLRLKSPEKSMLDVVVEASISRLRPVLLTTVTTVFGMIPLIFVSALWGPLAYAVIFGLLFATVLTLALVPILYYRWHEKVVE